MRKLDKVKDNELWVDIKRLEYVMNDVSQSLEYSKRVIEGFKKRFGCRGFKCSDNQEGN